MEETMKEKEHYELPNWFMRYNRSNVKFDHIEKEDIANFCMEFGITVEEYMKPTKETMEKIRDVYETKKADKMLEECMPHL